MNEFKPFLNFLNFRLFNSLTFRLSSFDVNFNVFCVFFLNIDSKRLFKLQNKLNEVLFMQSDAFSRFSEFNPIVDIIFMSFLEIG